MNRKFLERAAPAVCALERFGFCALWLLAVQFFSCVASFGVLRLYHGNEGWKWMVYVVCILLPLLWGLGGYWLPGKYCPRGRRQMLAFLVLWTVFPGALCWWSGQGGPDILWIILYPQQMARIAWFFPLFRTPETAFVLDTLQPLAAAGTHGLMMAGFAAGLSLSRNRKEGR